MTRIALLRALATAPGGVITANQALRAGFTRDEIRHLCRSGKWQRVARGRFVPFPGLDLAELRRVRIRAVVASLGEEAFAVLGTAAELHGVAGLRPDVAIHVSVPVDRPRPQRRSDPHVVVHQLTTSPDDLTVVGGVRCTTVRRTLADVILRVDRYPAVCALDSALHHGLLRPAELPLIGRQIRGRRGAVAARTCLTEADGRAQSPLETRTRLRCIDGRVPPDTLQLEVRDEHGHLLGVGDLGWRRQRVIAEADGQGVHSLPEAVLHDRRRQNGLVNAGWTVLRFTWQDTLDPHYIPRTIRRALTSPPR